MSLVYSSAPSASEIVLGEGIHNVNAS